MGKRLCSLLLAAALVGGTIPTAAAVEDIAIADTTENTDSILEESTDTGESIGSEAEAAEETADSSEESSEDADVGEQTIALEEADEEAPVETVSDLDDVSDLIQDTWEDDYYGEITVDPDTNQVEMDGETISLRSDLDLSKAEEKTVLSSASKAEDYFDSQPQYDAYTDDDGVVHVFNPYQTGRIIVYADQLEETYGASRVLYLEDYGEYILQYDSEEQTQLAYDALLAQYGSADCFLDQIYSSDMLMDDDSSGTETESEIEPASCYSWGASYMGLDSMKVQAVQYGLTSNSVTVAIVDTGIDKSHSFFSGRKISGHNFLISKNRSATNYTDDNGHGTHVAGILADCTPDNVNLMALRVFDATGSTTSTTVIDNALKYAYEKKVQIINMSLGTEDHSGVWDHTLQTINDAGIAVVAAAGNYTDTNRSLKVNYPASLSTTFAISALDMSGKIATYSCRGSTVDFAAPGTDVLSADAGRNVRYDSGTSMAAPHVSAAIAMIYLKHPTYTLSEVKQVLITYAVDRGAAGKDSKYGYGALCGLSAYYPEDDASIILTSATLKYSKMQYTGSARKDPVVEVKTSNGTVLPETSYSVSYSNNTAVGTATVTIIGKNGCKGTITKTFTIKPKNIKITSLKNTSARKMTVKWSKSLGYTGYQIQYASNASFTKGKHSIKQAGKSVSKTYSGLKKGKKYYVRVRAYKKVGSTTYYGTWSTVQSIKISK
jgi:cell wall-associated protease